MLNIIIVAFLAKDKKIYANIVPMLKSLTNYSIHCYCPFDLEI